MENITCEVKHPKEDKKLPVALSKEKVKKILDRTRHIRHRIRGIRS